MKDQLVLVIAMLACLTLSSCNNHNTMPDGSSGRPVQYTSDPRPQPVHPAQRQVNLLPPWPLFVAGAKCGGQPANSLQVLGPPTTSNFGYNWVSNQGWDLYASVDSRTKRVSEIYGLYGAAGTNSVADIISALGLDGKPYRAYMKATSIRGDQWLGFDVAYLQPDQHVLIISGVCEPDLLQSVTDFNTGKATYSLSPLFSFRVTKASGVFWGPIRLQNYDPGDADIVWTMPSSGAGAPPLK